MDGRDLSPPSPPPAQKKESKSDWEETALELRRALTRKGEELAALKREMEALRRTGERQQQKDQGHLEFSKWTASAGEGESHPQEEKISKEEMERLVQVRVNERLQALQEDQARRVALAQRFVQENPDLIPYRWAIGREFNAAQGTLEEKYEQAINAVREAIKTGQLPQVHASNQQLPPSPPGGQQMSPWGGIGGNEEGEQIVYNDAFLTQELKDWTRERAEDLERKKEAGAR